MKKSLKDRILSELVVERECPIPKYDWRTLKELINEARKIQDKLKGRYRAFDPQVEIWIHVDGHRILLDLVSVVTGKYTGKDSASGEDVTLDLKKILSRLP